jgi:hypothetical protein
MISGILVRSAPRLTDIVLALERRSAQHAQPEQRRA